MRLSCLQENLTRGLSIVGRAVAARTTLPIAQNVLLETDDGRLRLSATNLEIAITTWVGSMIEEEGAITVPARLISEFVGSLPQDNIDIVSTQSSGGVQLKSGRFDARINGTDASEFPPVPSLEEGSSLRISQRALKTAIGQTVLAAATEESRPVLTGVKVTCDGNKLTLAAADGFRLAVHQSILEQEVSEPLDVIIPGRTLNELSRLLGDHDGAVEIIASSSKSQIMFRINDIEVVSQLIQGNFPPYADLVADATKDIKARAVVRHSDLTRAAKTAAIFARDGNGIIKTEIFPDLNGGMGRLVISSSADEVGENTSEIDARIEGEEAKVAFNSKYMLDVLSVIDSEELVLETSGPSRAGVFKVPDSDGYLHLVMPMFINW